MSNRRKDVMDIRELLTQLRSGASDRRISQDTQIARLTVKQYYRAAGLLISMRENGTLRFIVSDHLGSASRYKFGRIYLASAVASSPRPILRPAFTFPLIRPAPTSPKNPSQTFAPFAL
jgi:hypothetical protein